MKRIFSFLTRLRPALPGAVLVIVSLIFAIIVNILHTGWIRETKDKLSDANRLAAQVSQNFARLQQKDEELPSVGSERAEDDRLFLSFLSGMFPSASSVKTYFRGQTDQGNSYCCSFRLDDEDMIAVYVVSNQSITEFAFSPVDILS